MNSFALLSKWAGSWLLLSVLVFTAQPCSADRYTCRKLMVTLPESVNSRFIAQVYWKGMGESVGIVHHMEAASEYQNPRKNGEIIEMLASAGATAPEDAILISDWANGENISDLYSIRIINNILV